MSVCVKTLQYFPALCSMKLKPFNKPTKLRGSHSAHTLTPFLFHHCMSLDSFLHRQALCCLCYMSSGASFPQYVPHWYLLKCHLLKEAFP